MTRGTGQFPADTSIDYVTPEEQLHLTYRNSMYPGQHQHLDLNYVNQRVDNVTLMSDFVYDSSYGLKSAAGVEVWLSDRDYIESVVTHTQPINANDYVTMFTRGVMKSRFNPNQSFVFDYALLNGTVNPNAMLNLTPYLEVPTQSPQSWRLLTPGQFSLTLGAKNDIRACRLDCIKSAIPGACYSYRNSCCRSR